jgi:starch phosphorylase
LGDGREHGDDPAWDATEADELYTLLEKKVIPEFYDRDQNGVPIAWVKRMRESMACLTPQFSANRTVREYTERYYIPAAKTYRKRSADNGASGPEIVEWRKSLNKGWSQLRIGDLSVETKGKKYLYEAQLYLNNIDPDGVRVELYTDNGDGSVQVLQEMKRGVCLEGMRNVFVYCAEVEAAGEAKDYKVRVIPCRPGIAVPLEANNILWPR